jgi:hypothetical protein
MLMSSRSSGNEENRARGWFDLSLQSPLRLRRIFDLKRMGGLRCPLPPARGRLARRGGVRVGVKGRSFIFEIVYILREK